jgi:hypothetical protein
MYALSVLPGETLIAINITMYFGFSKRKKSFTYKIGIYNLCPSVCLTVRQNPFTARSGGTVGQTFRQVGGDKRVISLAGFAVRKNDCTLTLQGLNFT